MGSLLPLLSVCCACSFSFFLFVADVKIIADSVHLQICGPLGCGEPRPDTPCAGMQTFHCPRIVAGAYPPLGGVLSHVAGFPSQQFIPQGPSDSPARWTSTLSCRRPNWCFPHTSAVATEHRPGRITVEFRLRLGKADPPPLGGGHPLGVVAASAGTRIA